MHAMIQDLFNDYIVYFGDEVPHSISSMICKCLPECDYYISGGQFSTVPLRNMNDIMLDVHYIGQTSFRYKTDIVITQMDLLGKSLSLSLFANFFTNTFVLHSSSAKCFPRILLENDKK